MYFSRLEKQDVYTVVIHDRWSSVEKAWGAAMASHSVSPMQSPGWLSSWYATIGQRPDVRPLLAEIVDRTSGALALGLPLAAITRDGLVTIEVADEGVTDYNVPIFGPAAPADAAGGALAFRALTDALPPADLLRFVKMPRYHGGICNPLTLLQSVRPSSLTGNRIQTGDSYEGWRKGLRRRHRREMRRILRVFESMGDAKFLRAHDRATAHAILDMIEAEQRRRISLSGARYRLDEESHAKFYRSIIDREDPSCLAIATALTLDGEIVSALFGILRGPNCNIMRLTFRDGFWTRAGPGRVVLERTLHALHQQGCHCFDIGVGDYDYKRQFQPDAVELFEIIRPLLLRGLPESSLAWAKSHARRNPAIRRLAKRLKAYSGG